MKKHNGLLMRYFIAFALLLCFRLSADQPHLQRSGSNVVTNPEINGSTGWELGGSTVYDSTVTKDAGSGSVKMTIAYPTTNYSYVCSGLISVTPGKTYTLAFYMRSDIFPPPGPTAYVGYYNSSQTYIRNSFGSIQSVAASGAWQECVYLFRPQPGEVYVKIKSTLMFQPIGYSGAVWLDNFYLGEGIGFEQAPTAKTAFNGTQTRIDALGNVEIYKADAWVPFFPVCVYGDGNRQDWTIYSSQGFNAEMASGSYVTIQRAKDAVSDFNPDGMMAALEIDGFISPGANQNNLTLLTTRINELKSNNLMSNLLWYYWDNENCYDEWAVPLAVTNKVKELDVDAGDNRMHPIYALQGNEGVARKYNSGSINMTDVIGDYVTQDVAATYPDETRGALGLVTLNNVEQQKNPVVIAQINHGVGMRFRPRIFTAIAKGAKGIGFWRDVYQGTDQNYAIDIASQPWWNDLPNIRREIDKLLPVIRTPHWTSWSLSSNNSLVDFGTRDYQGKGYVIVANEQDSAQTATFTISGLTSYVPSMIRNFMTDDIEAEISNSQFTVTIPAYGSRVYVLESNIEEMLILKLLCNENGGNTVYDASKFANNGTLIGNAAPGSGVLTLDGNGDFVNCAHGSSLEMGKLNLSVVARVKISTSQTGTYAGIVTKGAAMTSNAGYSFVYRTDTQKLTLILGDGSSRQFLVAPTAFNLKDNAWHTAGVSLDRDGNVEFYIDGVSKGTVSAPMSSVDITNTAQNLYVGSWGYGDYLNGQMDNIRIYKKALTSQEMADIAGNIIFDAQLNEASGATAYDSSINSNNGTLVGNAALGGGVMTLDGTGDYADFGNSSALDIGTIDMTIISRIKLDPTQNTYWGVVTKGAGSSADTGYALIYTGGHLSFLLSNGTSRVWVNSGSITLNDDLWHTVGVAVTRNGNAVFYVDGSSIGSGSVSSLSGYNITNTGRNLQLGSWLSYSAYSIRGSMDYSRIFKRALSADEMITATR